MTEITEEIRSALQAIIEDAYRISQDVGAQIDDLVREGRGRPLSAQDAEALISGIIQALREGAERRGDTAIAESLAGEQIDGKDFDDSPDHD